MQHVSKSVVYEDAPLEAAAGYDPTAERRRLEQLVAHQTEALSAALRAREEFLAVASHELKTPLTALRLQIQCMLRAAPRAPQATPDDARTLEALRSVNRQMARLSKLVDTLLDATQSLQGRLRLNPEPVDLTSLVQDVVARLEDCLASARCTVALAAPGPVLGYWDPLRLDQVVTNLLSNAMKYGQHRSIVVRVEQDAARVRLAVRDHGIGIRGEDHARIFECFERAAPLNGYSGLGLGLYVVRQIVHAHGGTVRVDSTPGAGATFTVELPWRIADAELARDGDGEVAAGVER